ncbi:sulfate ABC transporter permease subunit [Nocardioides sp. 1609]|uniref:sulfate ABC transporter permease n=1 Tax=Nocardioides sp. 1609 TaxID=2508327 RepID=UPI001FD6760C|nr:sulfate ABC transporter permease subunit [Nocardioides sp. 1609]
MANASSAVGTRSAGLTWFLRILVVVYLFMLVAWPTGLVAQNTFSNGLEGMRTALSDPDVTHSLRLTVQVAIIAVAINLVFGVGMSLLLVRFDFPGKRALSALIDLPLSVSPIVVGLALVLVYNPRYGWFGETLSDNGIDVVFATPGIVMATCFVALPLIIREVVPVLEEMGDEQEQAARSLGANSLQTFRRITLPGIKWAIVYGVVLSLARSLGEFGAVKIVAGKSIGDKETATLLVQREYQNFHQDVAYSVSFLLVVAAVLCLVVVALLRPKPESHRQLAKEKK